MSMTPEQVTEYLDAQDITNENTDATQSYTTNFHIITRNFKTLRDRINQVRRFTLYLYGQIDVGLIVQNVIETLLTNKIVIPVAHDLLEGNTVIVEDKWKVTRQAGDKIVIERQLQSSSWVTDNIIVQIKDVDGHIVYPAIVTANNKIEIYFIDGIMSNYKVFIL